MSALINNSISSCKIYPLGRFTLTNFYSYIFIYPVMSIALCSCTWYTEERNLGTTLGALFGGLLLGVILTTVAVIIIYRRSETHVNKRSVVTVEIILKLLLSFVNILEFHRFLETNSPLNFLIMMHAVLQKLLTPMLSKKFRQRIKR